MEKHLSPILLLLMWSIGSIAQDSEREFDYQEGDTTYTMKRYVFCMYLSGPERSQSEEEARLLQEKHLAHLASLEQEGLQMAGPFGGDSEKRGVLLFDLATTEEAAALIEKDPMVIEKRLIYTCDQLWLAKGTTLK
jgi:uncharacterized protein YciI